MGAPCVLSCPEVVGAIRAGDVRAPNRSGQGRRKDCRKFFWSRYNTGLGIKGPDDFKRVIIAGLGTIVEFGARPLPRTPQITGVRIIIIRFKADSFPRAVVGSIPHCYSHPFVIMIRIGIS